MPHLEEQHPGRSGPLGPEERRPIATLTATLGESWASTWAVRLSVPDTAGWARGGSGGQGHPELRGQAFMFLLADFTNFIF